MLLSCCFFSSRRRHTRCALVTGVQTCALPISREYYINDAGSQVDTLARSAHLRYREALGEDIGEIPEGYYPGEYLKPVGEALAAEFGDRYRSEEHTSELQSLMRISYAVFCLKKKQLPMHTEVVVFPMKYTSTRTHNRGPPQQS